MTKKTVKRKPMMIDVAEYMGDTRHLSPEEHGAYLLLLMYLHVNLELPTKNERFARIVGMTVPEWDKIRSTVLQLVHAQMAED